MRKGQAWSVKPRDMARAHAAELAAEAARGPSPEEVDAAVEAAEADGEPRSATPPSAWTVPWAAFRALIEWYELRGDERMAALLEHEMEQMAERKDRARKRLLEALDEA